MLLPEGAKLAAGEPEKIKAAVEALANDNHAPRELTVRVTLHVYHEYPKHVTVGKDKDENPIVKVAQNEEEEKALLAPPEKAGAEKGDS